MKKKKPIKVYVVEMGERHEGGTVIAIRHSEKDAIKVALGVKPCFDGGWLRVERENEADHHEWINGGDYVMVYPEEVL